MQIQTMHAFFCCCHVQIAPETMADNQTNCSKGGDYRECVEVLHHLGLLCDLDPKLLQEFSRDLLQHVCNKIRAIDISSLHYGAQVSFQASAVNP